MEDLVQEAFLRALRGLDTLADPARFGPWLVGIARHVCADWRKARAYLYADLYGHDGA